MLRAGVAIVPTPVPDQSGDGNLLDSDKVVYSVGSGITIPSKWFFGKPPLAIDFHYQVHKLEKRLITKSSTSNIGYKDGGYHAGGHVQIVGLQISLRF